MLSIIMNSTPPLIQTTSSAHDSDSLHPRDTRTPNNLPLLRHAVETPLSVGGPDRTLSRRSTLAILSHARSGQSRVALALFRESLADGRIEPDELSVTTVLKCCASLCSVRYAKEVHGFMVRSTGGKARTCSSESSLVVCYAKYGLLSDARKVFDQMPERDVVAWTTMLMACAREESYEEEMMNLFVEMMQGSVTPNCHTFSAMLSRATLEQGEQLHALVLKLGLGRDAFISSSLIDLYGRKGSSFLPELVFDRILHKDVVSYNSMLSCYGRLGNFERLIALFQDLCRAELVPNQSTCIGLLNGCAISGCANLSKQFHTQVIVRGFNLDEVVQGAVVDMYAKCGDLESAETAFDNIHTKQNAALWNSMISGYGKHGHVKESLRIFNSMKLASVYPDHITFICLLSACGHMGLIDMGMRLFLEMVEQYGIPPDDEHLCCIVDLLGRAGNVNEAFEFLKNLNFRVGPSAWGALLNACRVCGNVEIGEVAARRLFELEPECSGSYIALAGIYAEKEQFDEASAVRKLMDARSIRKDTGYSWINLGGVVYKFRAGDGMEGIDHFEIKLMANTLNASISHDFGLEYSPESKFAAYSISGIVES